MGPAANARGYSRKHLFEAVEQSLRRLKTDYIDIYQTHIWNPATDLGEMMDAYDDLVRSGKVLYVGITDMPFWQFALAQSHAARLGRTRFASVQNHYNLLWREDERELLPYCRAEGIGLIPYSPMARGFLCGRARRTGATRTERAKTDDFTYKLYGREADEAVVDAVAAVAAARGATPAQIALAWVAAQPGVNSPIIGAMRLEHVDQAVAPGDPPHARGMRRVGGALFAAAAPRLRCPRAAIACKDRYRCRASRSCLTSWPKSSTASRGRKAVNRLPPGCDHPICA
jgi:aryl-alcohol dehydrogenase (NADP+)